MIIITYSSIQNNEVRLIPLPGNEHCLFSEYIEQAKAPREWFDAHMYKCLPLSIANQYGYIIRAPYNFSFMWNGGHSPEDMDVRIEDSNIPHERKGIMDVKSSFGRGIMSIYPGFILKTAENMNLLIKNPPNYFRDNLTWLEGAVETDNLNTTFSYNIKVHTPNERVQIKQGDPIGCFLPYPRFFFDDFKLNVSTNEEELAYYSRKQTMFGAVRTNFTAPNSYRKGKDFDGCPFHNHQVVVNKPSKGEK